MNAVTLTRVVPASLGDVREAMLDVEPFTRAAGFDEVVVDGRTVRVTNDVGIAEIGLVLEVVDDSDATLAYEPVIQRLGVVVFHQYDPPARSQFIENIEESLVPPLWLQVTQVDGTERLLKALPDDHPDFPGFRVRIGVLPVERPPAFELVTNRMGISIEHSPNEWDETSRLPTPGSTGPTDANEALEG